MGKKRDLSEEEKKAIVQHLHAGKNSLEIAKLLQRDHRTVQRFCNEGKSSRKARQQPKFAKFSSRDLRKIKVEVARKPFSTSKQIFKEAGFANTSKTTRCKILKTIAKVRKVPVRPLLTKKHKEQRVSWAQKYMKQNFAQVIFTDECRATLDGPDGWAKGWVIAKDDKTTRLRRQQGGGGVMFWAAIVNDSIIGPVRVQDGLKMTAKTYCDLLKESLIPWYNSQSEKNRADLLFQQDNAPVHVAKYTKDWLSRQGFDTNKVMTWPPNSPDINPIENLWSIIKRKVYQNGRQYACKNELWEAIKQACMDVEPSAIKKLTESVDRRLFEIISGKGAYVNA